MPEGKELYEKGDVSLVFKNGVMEVVVGQEGKIQNITKIPVPYLVDKIEEAIPGDQKTIAAGLKGFLMVAA